MVQAHRKQAQEATVSVVYRHASNAAIAAAMAQDWAECRRLSQIARSIAEAYPDVSLRARFWEEADAVDQTAWPPATHSN